MDELLSLKWKNHSSTFLQVLSLIRKDQTYSDVTLACSGKFYSAHKFVLTACSDYFQDIFDHTDCKKPVIVLKGIDCSDLEVLLDYMYIGEVNVKQSDITSLIKAAECLQIKGLAVADDEPPKQDKSIPRKVLPSSQLSPNVKSKRKFSDSHSYSSEHKHFKANERPASSNMPKNILRTTKVEEEIEEVLPIYIKEEKTETYVPDPIDQLSFPEEETDLQAENSNSSSYIPQPSNSQVQQSYIPSSQPLNASTFQDASTEWPRDESNMNYSSFGDCDESNASNQVNKDTHQCELCGKEFAAAQNLQIHVRTHTGEKPFRCQYCPYSSNAKGNLKRHVILKHHMVTFQTDASRYPN